MSLFKDGSVAVPSLHRSDCLKTIKFFPEAVYVVEPHDADSYVSAGVKNVVVLPEDGRGLVYSKNFILNNSERNVIIVDDDVTTLLRKTSVVNGFVKFGKAENVGRLVSEHLFSLLDSGLSAVGPIRQSGARANPPKRINSFIAVNVKSIGETRYEPESLGLFDDFDFQLQLMKKGLRVAVTTQYGFDAPTLGTNRGGLNDGFRNRSRNMQALNWIVSKWPGVVDVHVKPRGPEPRIAWAKAGKVEVF